MLTVHEGLPSVQAYAYLAAATLELVWPHAASALLGYIKELAVRQVGTHLSDMQQGREATALLSIVTAANKAS